MKKIIATLFIMLLIISIFTSCKKSKTVDNKPEDTTAIPEYPLRENTKNIDPMERRALVSDDLSEDNFNGKEYIILTDDSQAEDMVSDTDTGELINDAIYRRNRKIEDRFNIKISVLSPGDYNTTSSYAKKSIIAGDNTFSLYASHVVAAAGNVTSDIF